MKNENRKVQKLSFPIDATKRVTFTPVAIGANIRLFTNFYSSQYSKIIYPILKATMKYHAFKLYTLLNENYTIQTSSPTTPMVTCTTYALYQNFAYNMFPSQDYLPPSLLSLRMIIRVTLNSEQKPQMMKAIPVRALRNYQKSDPVYFRLFLKISKRTREQPASASVGGSNEHAQERLKCHNDPFIMTAIRIYMMVIGIRAIPKPLNAGG